MKQKIKMLLDSYGNLHITVTEKRRVRAEVVLRPMQAINLVADLADTLDDFYADADDVDEIGPVAGNA